MTNLEIIERSIKKQNLNQLFAEALDSQPNSKIKLPTSEFDLATLITYLDSEDLLVTNTNYYDDQKDFMVINASGNILINVSKDGESINRKSFEYYLDDEYALDKLLQAYETIIHSNKICLFELAA